MAEELNMDSLMDDETLDFLESTSESDNPIQTTDPPVEKLEENENNNNQGGEDPGVKETGGTPSNNTESTNVDTERLTLFASALAEEGVLTLDDDIKVESFDDLAKLVEKTIRENELAGLTQEQKDYLNALEKGITTQEFQQSRQKIASVESITEDTVKQNEDMQRQLITEDFVSKGYSKEKAEKLAQRSFDLNENETDAIEALNAKKEAVKQATKAQEEQRAKELAQRQKEYEKTVATVKEKVFDEKSEVIPGFKFNKKLAEEVYDSIMKPVDTLENGTPISRAQKLRMENPVDFEHKLNYLLVLTKNFSDFSAFENKSKTKAANEFVNKLTNSSSQGRGFVNLGDADDLDWIEQNLNDL